MVDAQEQPWPSGNALDSDQRGPGFEAHCRPLVTSGRASGPKCSRQNYSPLRGTLQAPRIGGNGGKLKSIVVDTLKAKIRHGATLIVNANGPLHATCVTILVVYFSF